MIAFGVFISVAKLRENLHVSAGRAPLVVNVSGGQWWWEIDTYEIAMGQEVESCVKTEDVTHGMDIYAPDMTLVAQVQAMHGYTSKLAHTSDKPCSYQFLCMEFCGIAHHDMVNEFDVLEASQWLTVETRQYIATFIRWVPHVGACLLLVDLHLTCCNHIQYM